jgi:gluconolactonase
VFFHSSIRHIDTSVFTRMPESLRYHGRASAWSDANLGGRAVPSFIEGPCLDGAGNLYIVDIPHGRIFRIDAAREWHLLAEYEGEPNGLAWHPDGFLLVADYMNGLLSVDPVSGAVSKVLSRRNSERFKGLNDLIVARNGDIYFTDQGQTGLHDPTGRVYRLRVDGTLHCLIDNGPSPNGLVLNQDESVLYVSMTRDNSVWRMPLMPDGTVSKVGRFAYFHGSGGPDGMAVDAQDNLFVTHASLGSVFIFDRFGEPLARVRSCAGRIVTNVVIAPGNLLLITESETGSVLTAQW